MFQNHTQKKFIFLFLTPVVAGMVLGVSWTAFVVQPGAVERARASSRSINPSPPPKNDLIALPLNVVVDVPGVPLRLLVTQFSDARCPENPDVKCFWEGEVSVSGVAEETYAGQRNTNGFFLGTVTAPHSTVRLYNFGYDLELTGVSVPQKTVYIRVHSLTNI